MVRNQLRKFQIICLVSKFFKNESILSQEVSFEGQIRTCSKSDYLRINSCEVFDSEFQREESPNYQPTVCSKSSFSTCYLAGQLLHKAAMFSTSFPLLKKQGKKKKEVFNLLYTCTFLAQCEHFFTAFLSTQILKYCAHNNKNKLVDRFCSPN